MMPEELMNILAEEGSRERISGELIRFQSGLNSFSGMMDIVFTGRDELPQIVAMSDVVGKDDLEALTYQVQSE